MKLFTCFPGKVSAPWFPSVLDSPALTRVRHLTSRRTYLGGCLVSEPIASPTPDLNTNNGSPEHCHPGHVSHVSRHVLSCLQGRGAAEVVPAVFPIQVFSSSDSIQKENALLCAGEFYIVCRIESHARMT